MELELTENELDGAHRIGNPKSGNKRPRPINTKFTCYNTRRIVFVNKKSVKNTGISITKSLNQTQDGIFNKSKKQIWI